MDFQHQRKCSISSQVRSSASFAVREIGLIIHARVGSGNLPKKDVSERSCLNESAAAEDAKRHRTTTSTNADAWTEFRRQRRAHAWTARSMSASARALVSSVTYFKPSYFM